MKRFICALLAVVIMAPLTVIGAKTPESITVYCVSNLDPNISYIHLLLVDGKTYISIIDAERISGYAFGAHAKYEGKAGSASRNGKIVKMDDVIWHDQKSYIPLEKGLELLDTDVEMRAGILWLTAKVHTPEELYSFTDSIMRNVAYAPIINEIESKEGIWGKWGTELYLFASQGVDKALERISGAHAKEVYRDMLVQLIQPAEDDSFLAGVIIAAGGVVSALKPIKTIAKCLDYLSDAEFLTMLKELKKTNDELPYQLFDADVLTRGITKTAVLSGILTSDWIRHNTSPDVKSNTFRSIYQSISDPVNYLFQKAVKDSLFKFGGLDLKTQLDQVKYFYTLFSVAKTYPDMIEYTFYGSKKSIEWAPDYARSYLEDIHRTVNSDAYLDDVYTVLREEMLTILSQTALSTGGELLKALLKESIGSVPLFIIETSQGVLRLGFNLFAKMDKKTRYLEELAVLAKYQEAAQNLYNSYKKKDDKAINAKYSALFYLRCEQLKRKLFKNIYGDDEALIPELRQFPIFSDYDLTHVPKNPQIPQSILKEYSSIFNRTSHGMNEVDQRLKFHPDDLCRMIGRNKQDVQKLLPMLKDDKSNKLLYIQNRSVVFSYDKEGKVRSVRLNKCAFPYPILGVKMDMNQPQVLKTWVSQGFDPEIEKQPKAGNQIRCSWMGLKIGAYIENNRIDLINISMDQSDQWLQYVFEDEEQQEYSEPVEPDYCLKPQDWLGQWCADDEEYILNVTEARDDQIVFNLEIYKIDDYENVKASADSNASVVFSCESYNASYHLAGTLHSDGQTLTLTAKEMSDEIIPWSVVFTRCATVPDITITNVGKDLVVEKTEDGYTFRPSETTEDSASLLDIWNQNMFDDTEGSEFDLSIPYEGRIPYDGGEYEYVRGFQFNSLMFDLLDNYGCDWSSDQGILTCLIDMYDEYWYGDGTAYSLLDVDLSKADICLKRTDNYAWEFAVEEGVFIVYEYYDFYLFEISTAGEKRQVLVEIVSISEGGESINIIVL